MLATLSSASFKAQKSLALWLGLSVRVSAIKGKDSGNVNLLSEDVQEAIWQYYLDTIVKSKSTVATEYMVCIYSYLLKSSIMSLTTHPLSQTSIADFLTSFLTQKRYETELIRASEKLLLRAPEVIIKGIEYFYLVIQSLFIT